MAVTSIRYRLIHIYKLWLDKAYLANLYFIVLRDLLSDVLP